MTSGKNQIAPSARIRPETIVGNHCLIGREAFIGSNVVLGDWVRVFRYASIARRTVIEDGVVVGAGVRIGEKSLILSGAHICPNPVKSVSSNGRELRDNASIGQNVLLHDEVELGSSAIIPAQKTIAHLGNLGSKNRVVTIYGSDTGPLYSVGCQMGITLDKFKNRVDKTSCTDRMSADTYTPFMGILNEIGLVVQNGYDQETPYIEEIKAMRAELDLDS